MLPAAEDAVRDRLLFEEEQRFGGAWIWLVALVAGIGIFIPIGAHLNVDVTGPALHVQLWPFHLTAPVEIRVDDIESAEARTYSPIREYGGWGLRSGRSGQAYNSHGDRGVQLVMKNGQRILIGSQRPDELVDAIRLSQSSGGVGGTTFKEVQYFWQAGGLALLPVGAALLGVLVVFIFVNGRLRTEVRADAVYLRFSPFHRSFRRFEWKKIESAEARTYRPIREYGGWGIRGLRKNRAYNVRGDRGVQLVLTDGSRVMIGSARADEMAGAIRSARGG
jgi:hypothetical protein